ncbi:transporter substrate-binding domain-containing protein [Xylophilus rhododendri]|uniref:Transporter substrate-binding domain-containing protein n=1 Tax=Xylophilus rhododendri TaxID=2697032 RepID=A0A857J3L6_9BURK|nr:transporter substrate-binding domain-containing protein [Xylophilus rhododendri]QHI97833.1 transporter substrate-binding domain-containing protein [Xylophilus rhododendri]
MKLRPLLSALLVAGLACCATARADSLDDVQKSGVLRVAITLDYPPFGMVDASMSPQGYDVEFANLVAASLGVKAELVRVTAQSKIPTMGTRKADLLLNIGRNEERAKVVDFTQPYAPYFIGVFGPADQKASGVADLAGKKVAVTRGTIEEQLLSKMAPSGTDIQRYEDHSNTISSFLSGQSDLISVGNIVAAAIQEKNPARKPEQKFLLMNSPVCAAVTKGEQRLLDKVNAAISDIKAKGTLGKMATHWLKQPLPEGF